MKNRVLLATTILLVLCTLGFRFQAQRAVWEYKQICTIKDPKKPDNELRDIAQAGTEGWEMSGANTLFNSMSCVYFKRQK